MAQLQRTLGPVLIWGLGVGYVISGMYFGWNLGLPHGGPYGMLVATAVVTVLYVAFVLCYAELSCAMPRAGGVFVYTTRAFGPHIGFLGGIAQVVEYVLAPPAIAFAIGSYIHQLVPALPVEVIAIVAYVLFTLVNIVGVSLSVRFELILTVVAVIELCVFGCVALPHFSWAKFSADPLPNGWSGAFAALPFAIWFYLAIEGIANVAEDAKNPQRDLPRGFIAAMATLVVLTLITLFGAVGADGWQSVVYDPANQMKESDSPLPARDLAHRQPRQPVLRAAHGHRPDRPARELPRHPDRRQPLDHGLGRTRYVAALGVVSERTKTSVAALLANLVIGIAILLTGKTDGIILIAVFGALTLYVLSAAAVVELRRTAPDLPRPYRTPLYPATPLVAFALSLLCIGAMVWSYPAIAVVYGMLMAGAWMLFVLFVPPEHRASFAAPASDGAA